MFREDLTEEKIRENEENRIKREEIEELKWHEEIDSWEPEWNR